MAGLRDEFGISVSNPNIGRIVDEARAADMGSLRRGWESGRIGTELNPLRTQALDAKIAGDAQRQAELDAQVSALEQRQQMYAPRVSDLRDINGVGDGADWFAGQVGQGAASMLDPAAAAAGLGVVGRVAGAIPHPIAKGIGLAAQAGQFAVPWMMSKQQLTGEFLGEAQRDKELMANTSPQRLRDMAGNYGVVAGGLDSALPGMFGRQVTGLSRAGSAVARQSAMGAGAKFGIEALGEGATEGAQAAGSQYARGLLNPNRDTSGDNWDIANNFAGGMVGGAPFAGAGALAEAGHNRIDGGVDAVKGKAGEVVDLLNANPAVQEVKEAGKKWWQSGKKAVIDLQAAVADENGNITPSSVAGAAKGAVDMGVEKANRAAAKEELMNILQARMPPEIAQDTSPVGVAQQEAWVKASDARRGAAVTAMLKTMQDDPKAQELLTGVSDPDPVNQHIALTSAEEYVFDRIDQDELTEEAGVAKENQGAKLVGALGGLAGRAAMGVGKAAFDFGKAALSGAKEGMGRKKNMQTEQSSEQQSPYEDWLARTGRNKTTLAEEALNEANSAQTGPAKPEAVKVQQAMEKSLRRAQLFGEKLASVTKRNLSEEIGGYMRDVGFEIADLAESWGMTEGAGKPETIAPRMQGKGLELNLSNIANSMRVALGKGAIPVLDQLQSLADPKSMPMFDILRKHLQVGSTPEAREERKVLRATVADQLLMLLPPAQAATVMGQEVDKDGVSGPEHLLRSLERMGRGHLSVGQRKAIESAVGGRKVLNEMLQAVGAIAEPETVVGSVVDDRAQSGEENFEQNADDEGETTDFETRAQEKNVAKGAGGKVYGFHASPNLRTGSERRDPFSATEKLSPNDIAARELLGESTMMRPKLFKTGQKLFGGKSAIEKKVADVRAQLAGDPAYPDHANYDVRSKSAHEVMKDMNMQPSKVLQLFRDYAGEEEGAPGKAAAMARFVIVRSMRLDALRKAKLNGEPAPTFAPFRNPALKAAEASYNARFSEMRAGGQLDENVNHARAAFDKIVRAELNETAEAYFKDRHIVVGEKLSNQDADQIALPTILDMHRHGQALVEQSRVGDAPDGSGKTVLPKDMAAKKLSEANILMFRTKSNGRSTEFAIPAGDLVNWVRQQRGKTEESASEDTGGSFSNRSKDDEYLEDLSHGIASLIGSGHVQGMPYKINAQGGVEKFSKGIPDSLMLATTTYGAKKFGDEQRRSKQTPKTAAELQTVGNEEYDEEVAADANKNAEFFSPDDQAERTLEMGDPAGPQTPAFGGGAARVPKSGGEASTSLARTRDIDKLGREPGEKFTTPGFDPKTDDDHKTPLDFVGNQKSGEVADERTNQRWLSRQTGASTDMSPGPEPKARAASRAKFRAGEIMAVMNKDVEAGTDMIAARLRAARAPEYNENKPAFGKMTVPGVKGEDQVIGGAHYVAPLAYLANAARVARMNLSESEKEMFTDLRKQVAQILLESNLSGMNKLAIARLMSESPEKLTKENLDARLTRIVGGVTEGKPVVAKQEPASAAKAGLGTKQNMLAAATAKRQEYLDNPPADYSTEKAKGILSWATSQIARTQAEYDKAEGALGEGARAEELYDLRFGLRQLVAKAKSVIEGDASLAGFEGKPAPEVANAGLPKGQPTQSGGSEGRKLNAQTPYSGKLSDQPIFSDLADGSAEDQALVGKLDARLGRSADGRRAAVQPGSPNVDTARARRVAEAMGRRVVWVRNLGTEGVSDPAIPGVIFLNPASGRSVQVLAAHELAHSLERDNPAAFSQLVDDVRAHLDPAEWQQFVVRTQMAVLADGGERLSPAGLRSEMVANLLSDYAYRSHAEAAGAEFSARGGNFTGYVGYLLPGAQAKVDAALERFLAAHGHSAESFRNAQTDRTGGAYEGWKDGPSNVSTQAERDAAVAYAKKVLGPKIKVDFQDITGYSGEFIEATNTIVISTTAAAGTLNTLYHEALHAFFRDFVKGNPKVQAMFESLINDPKHLAKLHALLDGYPAAQAQLTSGEERLAYTYQFWKAGLLEVDAKASTWLQKLGKFFRRVAGRVRDSERALELFEAFDQGKMAELSAAGKVIAAAMAKGTNTLKFRRKMDAMFQGLAALTIPSAEILGMSVSPTARKLSTMFFTNPGEEAHGGEEIGLLNARRSTAQQYVNTSNRRFEGMSQMDKEQVQEHLQKETPLDKIAYAEHREAVKDIRQLLERFHKYMVDAGLDIGKVENYYPVVWNVDRVLSNKAKFINMLVTKYAAELAPADGDVQKAAERIHASLVSKDGIDKHLPAQREDGVLNPFFASQEMRTMPWLKAEDRAEYLEKDMPMTLTRYFNQGVHAAEYRRRFGKNGIKLEKMLATINEELSAAGKEMLRRGEFKDEAARVKWVGRQMRDVVQATGAMEGSLGKDVSPSMRKFNSWMTVYQNVRLLPMALFSSFVDPLALVARGAPFKAAYETFMYSMREVFRNWGDAFKDMPPARQKDEWRQLSELIGASEIAVFQHQVSDLYASTYMTPGAKKLNDKMFTFNGMEAWNRGTRIMATKWAVRFLEQHAGLPDKNHSARWLKELGLTPAMITLDDGKLVTTPQQLMAMKGITLDEARAQVAPIHAALNRWVEGAVLTPNAAQRPSWGSDPNFASMFHLKQFSYSFHQTILKRAANEFNHGNVAPLAALAAFIPTMIGADIMKGLIQGGGSLPPYMAGMNAGDWVMHATQRAGLHGIGVIGVDAANDWASLGGPAFEQIADAGRDGFGSKSALNALPLHALYGQLVQ